MPDRHFTGLHYGIANGKLLHVSEVARGLSCGCVCPSCGAILVAKQGRIREHHFAHSTGEPCRYAGETALHLAAKDILEKRRELVLPAVEVPFHSHALTIAPDRRYQIDSISVEHRFANIVPDVLLHIGGHPLLVEIKVTHGVDDHKLRQIEKMGISAVEIDLSSAPRDYPPDELENIIVEDSAHKTWLYNVISDRQRKRMVSDADDLGVRGGAPDVIQEARDGWAAARGSGRDTRRKTFAAVSPELLKCGDVLAVLGASA